MYYHIGDVVVNSKVLGLAPGSNLTIVSYNASVVKMYNTTSSLPVRDVKRIILHTCINALAHCNAGAVVAVAAVLELA
jgi:hypothetical protein